MMLYQSKSLMFQCRVHFKNSSSVPAVRPGCAMCTASEISGNDSGFTNL